jgi:CheY-like chemotaxis protein
MSAPDSWNAAKPRVLIAAPAHDTRARLLDLFDTAGWQVTVATDGRDALVQALSHPPSLLVTDTQLGFISGIELCQLLRTDDVTRDLPIIVVAGTSGTNLFARATDAGANVVLEHPLSMEALLDHATDLTRSGRWRFWRPRRRRPPGAR